MKTIRPRIDLLLAAVIVCAMFVNPLKADVYRWDTGAVIPGTEGITPEPGVDLDHLDLGYAALHEMDLSGASFEASQLTRARLYSSILTNANFNGADLTGARMSNSMQGASLTGAIVKEADLCGSGITEDQLHSTASHHTKDLQGIGLCVSDLTGWDLAGQNLGHAILGLANLTGADLAGANGATERGTYGDGGGQHGIR